MLLNVVGLDLVGSTVILGMGGVRRRHLQLEKHIREIVSMTLDVVPGFISVGSTADVTLLQERAARIEVICRRRFGGRVPETLAETIANDVQRETGCRCEVTVEVVPLPTYESTHYG